MIDTEIFEMRESAARSYCRLWPAVFDRAVGSSVFDESGARYLDFFAGAGALNYGHNDPDMKRALVDYLSRDGVAHSLDMYTTAKREFLTAFDEIILRPRGLDYRIQFAGPAGANAVEAALKLARKVTNRSGVISFTNSFHGVTLGALSVTGNSHHRGGAGLPLTHVTPMPFDQYLEGAKPDVRLLEQLVEDSGSGLGVPAAVIVETVQGEGGVRVARPEWLQALSEFCTRHDIVLIVDDIQMGCGRTGPFFSFERASIRPDIVCLSKSISGFGLPLALTLIRSDLDIWKPGEHNGTFRGVNAAFVTGAAALRGYWRDAALESSTLAKGDRVRAALGELEGSVVAASLRHRGVGLANGLVFEQAGLAGKVSRAAFERGLLVETAGPRDEVVKLLPPLTISDSELDDAVRAVC
jgi:diaminobutyrate-2-oxoglutarate transaminase